MDVGFPVSFWYCFCSFLLVSIMGNLWLVDISADEAAVISLASSRSTWKECDLPTWLFGR